MPGADEPVVVDGWAGSSALGRDGGEAGFAGGRDGPGGVVVGTGGVVGASICCGGGLCPTEPPSVCRAATVSPDPPPADCDGDEV